jgi:2-keto-4-pentenoate hydratase
VLATQGSGSDALGDPRCALAWLVNHVSQRRIDLFEGQFVTTGVCGNPTSVGAVSHVQVEVESYGTVEVNLFNSA